MINKKFYALICLIFAVLASGCSGGDGSGTQTTSTEAKETVEQTDKKSNGFSTAYKIENAKDGYFIVSKLDGSLYGLLDSSGDEVIPLEYDSITFPESREAQAVIVKAEGKMGLYGYDGDVIMPLEYESIISSCFESEYYLAEKDGVQRILKLDGSEYKSLSDKYDSIIGNAFLVEGTGPAYTEVYSFEEQNLFSGEIESANGSFAYGLDSVNDYIAICRFNTSMDLMDSKGNIVLSYPYVNESGGYGMMEDLNCSQVIKFDYYPNGVKNTYQYKLLNFEQNSVSEKYYNKIISNDEAIFALLSNEGTNSYNVDVYSLDGTLKNTLTFDAEAVNIVNYSSLISVKNGDTYRIYDKEGKELTNERYLKAETINGFLMLQNLDGEYGLMDNDGNMRIEFGGMGDESYGGTKWEDTYVFDDTFCIVTESSSATNVWMF